MEKMEEGKKRAGLALAVLLFDFGAAHVIVQVERLIKKMPMKAAPSGSIVQ